MSYFAHYELVIWTCHGWALDVASPDSYGFYFVVVVVLEKRDRDRDWSLYELLLSGLSLPLYLLSWEYLQLSYLQFPFNQL